MNAEIPPPDARLFDKVKIIQLSAVRDQQRAASEDDGLPNGAPVLDAVHAFLGRFVAYPSVHAHVAHTLWIAHAHLMEAWESTPRIAFLSPEPGSGKTRALEVSELLVPCPVNAVNVSSAYLFRRVGGGGPLPTILFDEIDTVFGPRSRDNEEIRGLLNAGHRRGAVAGRCVVRGKTILTEELPAFCAVALAGIGELPDTILSRSVIIKMRKRAPSEVVEPFRRRVHAGEGERIRARLARWAGTVLPGVTNVCPDMPSGIADRDADVWEALLAVADAAGGDWPDRARVSAVSLVSLLRDTNPSLGVRLLHDLRQVFADAEALRTETILERLNGLEESPWGDLRGKPLDARGLSSRLRKYGVSPKQIRIQGWTGKGYAKQDLHDAWSRYLGAPIGESETRETSETSVRRDGPEGNECWPAAEESATRETSFQDLKGSRDREVVLVDDEPKLVSNNNTSMRKTKKPTVSSSWPEIPSFLLRQ